MRLQNFVSAVVFVSATLFSGSYVSADLTITVTPNVAGGTNWTFSGGSGIATGTGNNFLPGGTIANPQLFYASVGSDFDGLSVLAGSNPFGLDQIVVSDAGGSLPGTNGALYDEIDFQGGTLIGGQSIAGMNGTVLYADQLDFSSLNTGTYMLDSYYTTYTTELGIITLNVGAVPEPSSLIMFVSLGLFGNCCFGRRKR